MCIHYPAFFYLSVKLDSSPGSGCELKYSQHDSNRSCYAQNKNASVSVGGVMEFNDVREGFILGTLKEIIIEPNGPDLGWVILLRDLQDSLTPLTFEGEKRIFSDLYFATSFAHSMGSSNIRLLEPFS